MQLSIYYIFPVERESEDGGDIQNYFSAYNSEIDLNQGRPGQPTRYETDSLETLAHVLVNGHFEYWNRIKGGQLPLDIELAFSFNAPCAAFVDEKFISRVSGEFGMKWNKEEDYVFRVQKKLFLKCGALLIHRSKGFGA